MTSRSSRGGVRRHRHAPNSLTVQNCRTAAVTRRSASGCGASNRHVPKVPLTPSQRYPGRDAPPCQRLRRAPRHTTDRPKKEATRPSRAVGPEVVKPSFSAAWTKAADGATTTPPVARPAPSTGTPTAPRSTDCKSQAIGSRHTASIRRAGGDRPAVGGNVTVNTDHAAKISGPTNGSHTVSGAGCRPYPPPQHTAQRSCNDARPLSAAGAAGPTADGGWQWR